MLDLIPGMEIEELLVTGPDTADPALEDPSYSEEYVPDPRN